MLLFTSVYYIKYVFFRLLNKQIKFCFLRFSIKNCDQRHKLVQQKIVHIARGGFLKKL